MPPRRISRTGNALKDTGGEARELGKEADKINAELRSLRQRKNNIPKRNLDLRQLLCRELGLAESALPFAGELLAVRPGQSDWEGAAERLLHSFALSILVPQRDYAAVSDWINDHFLSGRVVYYRVPDLPPAAHGGAPVPPPASASGGNTLSAKLDIRDSPFAAWLERELASRADYTCAETMADFRRAPRAITKAGQIKGSGGRHEKDDRSRIDDRSTYVLGWTNERKIDALLRRASAIHGKQVALAAAEQLVKAELDAAIDRGQVLAGLDQTHEFAEIDWQYVVNRLEELKEEKRALEAASAELTRLNRELDSVREQIDDIDGQHGQVRERIGSVSSQIDVARGSLDEANKTLAEPGCEPARAHFPAIGELLAGPTLAELRPRTPAACDRAEMAAAGEVIALTDRRAARKAVLSNRIVAAMGEFRRQYPVETAELDNAVAAATATAS